MIDVAHLNGGVDDHEDDIGAADGALGAVEGVELKIVARDLGFFADAGGVDDHEAVAVAVEEDVDGIARGAGDFGNDDARLSGEGVDEGGLAGVAFTDDGDFHFRDGFFFCAFEVEALDDFGEEFVLALAGGAGDGDGVAEAEGEEVGSLECEFFAIGFVGDEEDGFVFGAEEFGDDGVERDFAGLDIDDEEDELGFVDAEFDLAFDVAGEVVLVDDAVAAGVSELEDVAVEIDGGGDAVARDALGGVDDGDASTGEEVEEGGFADVGAADNGDDGKRQEGGP